MCSDLLCPHCLHAIRTSGDASDPITRCTTCGKPFFNTAAPRAMTIHAGMKGRRDDDDDYDDEYEDDEYEDDRPSRRDRRSRGGQKPGKVLAMGIMALCGGILACLGGAWAFLYMGMWGLGTLGFGFLCCLWPGPYYGITAGILAIIKGSQLLGENAQSLQPPRTTGILLIICVGNLANILMLDIVNCFIAVALCVVGILILVFCSDPEVENWFRG